MKVGEGRRRARGLYSAKWLCVLFPTVAAGNATFYPSRDVALAACRSEYATVTANECYTSGEAYYRWCGETYCGTNYGGGLYSCPGNQQIWRSVTIGASCATLVTQLTHRFVYPLSPPPTGLALVGPTSSDVVPSESLPEQEKHLGACNNDWDGTASAERGMVGNPCDAGTGNKIETAVDYQGGDGVPFFVRLYNSQLARNLGLGYGWVGNHGALIAPQGTSELDLRLPSGQRYRYSKTAGGEWITDADSRLRLTEAPTHYDVSHPNGNVDRFNKAGQLVSRVTPLGWVTTYGYDSNGNLASITGPFGHRLTLGYDAYRRLTSLTDPANQKITYSYDARWNLTRVTYPDGKYRSYHYENPAFSHYLTGVTDENGHRFATFAYDAQGRAIETAHATTDNDTPQQRYNLNHAAATVRASLSAGAVTQTTVTDAAGHVQTLTFGTQHGQKLLTSRVSAVDGKGIVQQFNDRNRLSSRTDEERRTTVYGYNAAGQLDSVTEAHGTTQARTTTYQYLASEVDLPTQVVSPSTWPGQSRTVAISYDGARRPISIAESGYGPTGLAVSRLTAFTYSNQGRITSIDGPRTDINDTTTLEWYECTTGGACGQLRRIVNALGQATTFDTYDGHGRLTRKTDPNGLVTTYTYHATRGWLAAVTETPPSGVVRVTQYTYTNAGQLKTIATPGGRTLTLVYDAAHDLKSITDNLGNQVVYRYDARGNRTLAQVKDPGGTIVKTVETAFDLRNRPYQVNRAGSLTQLVYDAIGNLTRVTDANGNPPTRHYYDALNRLNASVDALGGTTQIGQDVTGFRAQIVAPNGATTTIYRDDLDRIAQEISADRGTLNYTTDPAGNITSVADARGIQALYTYDAANRPTAIDYPGAAEDIAYTYDTCSNGIGHLCRIADSAGTTNLVYDAFGNVTEHRRTELGITQTTRYTHDAANRVISIVYPDGRVLTYTRDSLGRITSINIPVNGTARNIVSARTWRADGLLKTQIFGNNLSESRTHNQRGELETQAIGSLETRTYGRDANGNLTLLTAGGWSGAYGYDALDRLDRINSQTLSYDANGNRLFDRIGYYGYQTATNRLSLTPEGGVVTDTAGNTTLGGLGKGAARLDWSRVVTGCCRHELRNRGEVSDDPNGEFRV